MGGVINGKLMWRNVVWSIFGRKVQEDLDYYIIKNSKHEQKVGMIGRMELEKLPRCWGGRELERTWEVFLWVC